MKRGQKGFSLAEVALGVAIVTALSGLIGGTATVLQARARAKDHINKAQEWLEGLDRYMMAHGGYQYPMAGPGMEQFVPWWNTMMKYPYGTWGGGYISWWGSWANNSYPNNAAQGNYPMTDELNRQMILYFFKGDYSWDQVYVWDGFQQRKYDYYGVQVLDEKGYPLWTGGR